MKKRNEKSGIPSAVRAKLTEICIRFVTLESEDQKKALAYIKDLQHNSKHGEEVDQAVESLLSEDFNEE